MGPKSSPRSSTGRITTRTSFGPIRLLMRWRSRRQPLPCLEKRRQRGEPPGPRRRSGFSQPGVRAMGYFTMRVLGIETTCDETAAAVVRLKPDGTAEILADEVMSQIAAHAPFGGVVP